MSENVQNVSMAADAARPAVLVALADAERAAALAEALEGRGQTTLLASHGVEALERALASAARLVIAGHGLPLVDAPRLAEIVRSNPRTRGARFLFIGEPEGGADGEGAAFELGVGDQQLPATLRNDDLVDAASEMLAQQDWIHDFDRATRHGETGSGSLDQLDIADLIQLLHLGGKTGCLEVDHEAPDARCSEGVIWFRGGEIVDARAGLAEGEKAVFRMLQWREGYFRFGPGRGEPVARVLAPTRSLLAEGLRQSAEWTRLGNRLPPLDARVRLRVKTGDLPASVHPLTHEVLVLLEVYDRVADILDHATFPDYQVLRTLHTLAERELLQIGHAEGASLDVPGDGLFSQAQVRRLREWMRDAQGRPRELQPARLCVAAADPAALADLANLLRPIDGVELSHEMERGRIGADEVTTLATVRVDDDHAIELVHVPSLPRFAPFWRRAAHGTLGTIFLLSGSVGRSAGQLAPMLDAVKSLPRARVFHAVLLGKRERLSPDELRENLSLMDDASLFLLPLESGKDPASLLARLFGRIVP